MLCLRNLSINHRLTDIDLKLEQGQLVHVLGNNGAGKSTLLSVISGLLIPDQGSVLLNGKGLDDYTLQELACIRCFQEQNHSQVFSMTVKESLQFFASTDLLPEQLESALEISQFMHRNINTLSGGELRRVHIARVLLQVWPVIEQGRALILLDEPSQGLDYRHQHLLMQMLKQLVTSGNLVMVSHHDLNLCYQYADQLVLMKERAIFAADKVQSIMTAEFLEEVFCCKISSYSDESGKRLFQTYLE